MDIVSSHRRARQKLRREPTRAKHDTQSKSRRRTRPVSANEPFVYQLGKAYDSRQVPFFGVASYSERVVAQATAAKEDVSLDQETQEMHGMGDATYHASQPTLRYEAADGYTFALPETEDGVARGGASFSLRDVFRPQHVRGFSVRQVSMKFVLTAAFALFVTGSALFVGNVFAVRDRTVDHGEQLLAHAKSVFAGGEKTDFTRVRSDMQDIRTILQATQEDFDSINNFAIWSSQFVPGASQLASGDALATAGVDLTQGVDHVLAIGQLAQERAKEHTSAQQSLLPLTNAVFTEARAAHENFVAADTALARVRIDDVPEDARGYVLNIQDVLPTVIGGLDDLLVIEPLIRDVLGANGPRKYLFLFQNNNEARPTGGFIGSYGLLDIADGHIRSFGIDGIYNPDGQLADKIVPPLPIQKISAAWSLHDSNWWPDFPTSAATAIDFYERTGGPSVDGVIMLTPTMMEKLLAITGPIVMDDYGVTLTAENFVEQTQYEVEEDYDKEENRPKQILSDLMPKVMEKLTGETLAANLVPLVNMMMDGVAEKHMMLYATDPDVQAVLDHYRLSGRVAETDDNYLSVINTNINGFKTDGVIDQNIAHTVEILDDGTVRNTVTITREHRGGHTGRAWWDAVNADYMRVYVPAGAALVSAEGYTREINEPRLDYDALGFERNALVAAEESGMHIDPETGTRIYTENGKTVFANWVYVSPQESVRVTYVYTLPQKVQFEYSDEGLLATHGVLYQKQSGSTNTTLTSTIVVPDDIDIVWSTADDRHTGVTDVLIGALDTDHYHGVVARKKE